MANARKRKARKARRAVNRGDRVKATPETLARLKPHPLEILLARGREGGGIDADQLQCAEEIVDAFAGVTRGLGFAQSTLEQIGHYQPDRQITPREERLSVIWFTWAVELMRCLLIRPVDVVQLIAYIGPAETERARMLAQALDLWAKARQDTDRSSREISTIRPNPLDSVPALA